MNIFYRGMFQYNFVLIRNVGGGGGGGESGGALNPPKAIKLDNFHYIHRDLLK